MATLTFRFQVTHLARLRHHWLTTLSSCRTGQTWRSTVSSYGGQQSPVVRCSDDRERGTRHICPRCLTGHENAKPTVRNRVRGIAEETGLAGAVPGAVPPQSPRYRRVGRPDTAVATDREMAIEPSDGRREHIGFGLLRGVTGQPLRPGRRRSSASAPTPFVAGEGDFAGGYPMALQDGLGPSGSRPSTVAGGSVATRRCAGDT